MRLSSPGLSATLVEVEGPQDLPSALHWGPPPPHIAVPSATRWCTPMNPARHLQTHVATEGPTCATSRSQGFQRVALR